MTTLVFPAVRHDNITSSEHRQLAVRFARRALHPAAAVILGMETTTPGSGSLAGRRSYQNLLNTGRTRLRY